MESAVPYSLSDIQLPESPSNTVKPVVKSTSQKKESLSLPPVNDSSDRDSHSDNDVHRNGLNSKKSKEKIVLEDASNKSKVLVKEPSEIGHQKQVLKMSSKASKIAVESALERKSRQSKKKEVLDTCKEKPTRKVKEKRYKKVGEHAESHSNSDSSSSEKSSCSNEDRKKRQPRSKIDSKQTKLQKKKSRSTSSSSRSTSSQERIPDKSKDPKGVQTKSAETGASRTSKRLQKEDSNKKTLKSKSLSSSSSSSSQSSKSRDTSPVEKLKLDVKQKVTHGDKSSSIDKTSRSQSKSPSNSKNRKSGKALKDNDKKFIQLDTSKTVKEHRSKNYSKSSSRSPSSSRSSQSPEKPSRGVMKKSIESVTSRLESTADQHTSKNKSMRKSVESVASRSESTADQYASKNKSHSSSSSQEQSHMKKPSKGRSGSSSSSRSSESPVKIPTKAFEEGKTVVPVDSTIVKKHHADSDSNQGDSRSRSRSPSKSRSSKSRERSPKKMSDDKETVRNSDSDQNASKSKSVIQEENTMKSSKSVFKKSEISDTTNSGDKKHQTESNSSQKASNRISRFSSSNPPKAEETVSSQSKKKRVMPPLEENDEVHTKTLKPETDSKKFEEANNKTLTAIKQEPEVSHDPPRKKLKINRNNVVIPPPESTEKAPVNEPKELSSVSLREKTTEVLPSSPKEEIELSKSESPIEIEGIEREMGEIIENSPEVKYESRKIKFPGRKLSRKSSEDVSSSEPKSKKSKWGKFASSQKSSQTINISTDSLKNWFPEFKLVNEPQVVNDLIPDESPPIKEDKKPFFIKTEEDSSKQTSSNASHQYNEEVSVDTTDSCGPVSKIVFIQNLVRPFTLLQLKDLLKQTGDFSEEDFWIDKIKSKCFVTYATEDDAIKTRKALNGVRWPPSNPKILNLEFSTEEEFERHRSGKDTQKQDAERLPETQDSHEEKTSVEKSADNRRKDRDGDRRKERERYRQQMPVREWDKDKVLLDSPDREKAYKDIEGFRESDRKDKKDAKKKANEDTPAKLLDDLFQKTKSVPCIYWLPLTEALVLEHEESRRLRRLEREKMNQQREKEESEHRNRRSRPDHKTREQDIRRSSTRSRSPTSRRR